MFTVDFWCFEFANKLITTHLFSRSPRWSFISFPFEQKLHLQQTLFKYFNLKWRAYNSQMLTSFFRPNKRFFKTRSTTKLFPLLILQIISQNFTIEWNLIDREMSWQVFFLTVGKRIIQLENGRTVKIHLIGFKSLEIRNKKLGVGN